VTSSARSRSRVSERPVGRQEPKWLSLDTILALHAQQVERFGGSHGVLDVGAVESAVARPRHRFHYGETPDLADLAAAYLFGFAAKQGFVDGNKRIGVAAMLVFLALNRRPLHVQPDELYALAMDVANHRITEAQVAEWLRRHV
jgi:death-on-curing protein